MQSKGPPRVTHLIASESAGADTSSQRRSRLGSSRRALDAALVHDKTIYALFWKEFGEFLARLGRSGARAASTDEFADLATL